MHDSGVRKFITEFKGILEDLRCEVTDEIDTLIMETNFSNDEKKNQDQSQYTFEHFPTNFGEII